LKRVDASPTCEDFLKIAGFSATPLDLR
jgi:hypothetical protein